MKGIAVLVTILGVLMFFASVAFGFAGVWAPDADTVERFAQSSTIAVIAFAVFAIGAVGCWAAVLTND